MVERIAPRSYNAIIPKFGIAELTIMLALTRILFRLLCLSAACAATLLASSARATPYIAVDPARQEQPPIVLSFDAASGAGFAWSELTKPRLAANKPEARLRDAVLFLQEGIRRMTGATLEVASGNDLSRGIVLTLVRHAAAQIRDDPQVKQALRNDGSDAMHMVVHRTFGWENTRLENLLPEEQRRGPAHYTTAETSAWWQLLHERWPEIDVALFSDAVLADGRRGRDVDLNDLVRVADFQSLTAGKPLLYNSAQAPNYSFLTAANSGEPIGFKFHWPANDDVPRFYGPKDVPYGIEHWDTRQRRWNPLVDVTLATAASQRIAETHDGKPRQVVEVTMPAPQRGTYRVEVGRGGFLANLTSLSYNVSKGEFTSRSPHTYFSRLSGLTQDPAWLYVPKGTQSLDLETWDRTTRREVQLFRGQGAKGPLPSRTVDISRRGTHRVSLEAGEDGNLARISGNGFAFPLLYSVPSYWAKCPAELLVPRSIAEADGLKIVKPLPAVTSVNFLFMKG